MKAWFDLVCLKVVEECTRVGESSKVYVSVRLGISVEHLTIIGTIKVFFRS